MHDGGMMTDRKQCSKCGELKPGSDFNKDGKRNGVQRYRSSCSPCEHERNKLYMEEYLSDPERRVKTLKEIRERVARRRAKDPEGGRAYRRVHKTLRRSLGPASEYTCIGCGNQAEEWSLRPDAKGLIRTALHSWSESITDYDPRCVPCHRALDKEIRRSAAA